jgi:hypothetical protein
MPSRFSPISVCITLFDYAIVLGWAVMASLWWVAVSFAFDSDPSRMDGSCLVMIVAWTLFGMVLFWRGVNRRIWRIIGAAALLVIGSVCFLWVKAFTRELNNSSGDAYILMAQGGVLILCLVVLLVVRRYALTRGWLTLITRGVLALGLAGYLVYLCWDESAAPCVARNHATMSGRSEDEPTFMLTVRYAAAHGGGKVFTPPSRKMDFSKTGEKRRAYLLAHRSDIEANWAELSEVRAWWTEMVAHPELGDRPATSFDYPLIRFQPVRVYTQHALAIASLQALDGDGDAALLTVAEVYKLGARLEPASCTLVRSMIAISTQKQALEAADFVLTTAPVSVEARKRFSDLLAESGASGIGAKRLILTESTGFFWSADYIASLGAGSAYAQVDKTFAATVRRVGSLMITVALNSQATSNLIHDYHERLASCAEARDLKGIVKADAELKKALFRDVRIKNISGRLLLNMTVSPLDRVVKSYWENQDKRDALTKRLLDAPPVIQ